MGVRSYTGRLEPPGTDAQGEAKEKPRAQFEVTSMDFGASGKAWKVLSCLGRLQVLCSGDFSSRETLTLCPPSVPGPCEPEDLIDGIIFAANYLGSTQLLSERNPSKNIRMMQAQEAVSRVKRMQKAAKIKKKANSEGDAQMLTEVDLFISTQRIKVLNADTQETMMDHALRTISYIADIGNIVVLMARRRMPRSASQDCIETTPGAQEGKKQYKMICHVFESEDAQLIAQSIGQAFSVAYQEFLRANGINPEDLSQKEYSDIINTQEMYNDDLIHFSNSENCKELQLEKHKGEILGVVVVESGWGSILPTVILANMMNGGPAARSGKLSIGDQIMSINGTSLVGLPLATCQGIIKGLKNQTQVKLNIVSCPPVTTVLIKRPDLKYQLGFSVQNGIICSLMRGGIAERGGVRVGHRIIEINGQSVVATAHEKIVQALSNSVGEIHMKTMPAAMFRLLTGQETPLLATQPGHRAGPPGPRGAGSRAADLTPTPQPSHGHWLREGHALTTHLVFFFPLCPKG
ncbi:Amyloid-beta A4 precursor protein-binding family A member 2, partial [Plecturocebus cupreus]